AGRQGAALAGLEVHDVVADGSSLQRKGSLPCFFQQIQIDSKTPVSGLGSADRLKDEVDRRAGLDGADLVGDVGEDAGLGRDLEAPDQLVERAPEGEEVMQPVPGRVDADHGVAAAIEQAVEDGG